MDESICLTTLHEGLAAIIGTENICLIIQLDCFVRAVYDLLPFIAMSFSTGKVDVKLLRHQLDMFESYYVILNMLCVIRSNEIDNFSLQRFEKTGVLMRKFNTILF